VINFIKPLAVLTAYYFICIVLVFENPVIAVVFSAFVSTVSLFFIYNLAIERNNLILAICAISEDIEKNGEDISVDDSQKLNGSHPVH